MIRLETDVFIVGAGPTGLACAALLAREGLRTLAITRYSGLANSPRAHITNQRTMEVLRDLGIEERVKAAAMPGKFMGRVIWAESFAGPELARRHSWGAGASRLSDYARASPTDLCNIHQHLLEPILAETACAQGAEIRYSLELETMRQEADRVISICRDRRSGETVEVVSAYAIGADGDNSAVCREIGFATEGQMGLGHMVNYWIRADLARYCAHRPGALYQIMQPGGRFWAGTGIFVTVAPWDEWVMSMPYDPAEGPPDLSAQAATEHARRLVGDPELAVTLISAATWTINQVYATQMHRDRVLIAGNAAHRHPPAGGLGANTCIQDAFNLCWKLAMVARGEAGPALLASYHDERQPIARQIVLRANASMRNLFAMAEALGLQPDQSAKAGAAAIAGLAAPGPDGARRRARLAAALELQDYNFNALGVEMGQVYRSGAVLAEGPVPTPAQDPELYHAASTAPGAALPHAWVVRAGQEVSTLDLVGRGRFCVLTGPGGGPWVEAAQTLAAQTGLRIDGLTIGPGGTAEDLYGSWAGLREVSETGCLLIRPDRHIAWRAESLCPDPQGSLGHALSRILARG